MTTPPSITEMDETAGSFTEVEEVAEETTQDQQTEEVHPLTEVEKDKVADAISKSVSEKIFFCDESASVFF